MLLEADGAPGAVGRALVTVRNLGGGTLARPAWGCSLPGGETVSPPLPGEGAGVPRGQRGGEERLLPDNPQLEAFFPRGSRLHDSLFFRVGGGGVVVPFNERVRSGWVTRKSGLEFYRVQCCCCQR